MYEEGRVVKIIDFSGDGYRLEFQNGQRDILTDDVLELLEPSLDTLFVGDVVVDFGVEKKISGICGGIVFIKELPIRIGEDTFKGKGAVVGYTIKDLKDKGYTLKQSPEGSEDDVCEDKGRHCWDRNHPCVDCCFCHDPKLIEIDGKKYNKSDILEKIKDLKEI